jgi:hypothetical protein
VCRFYGRNPDHHCPALWYKPLQETIKNNVTSVVRYLSQLVPLCTTQIAAKREPVQEDAAANALMCKCAVLLQRHEAPNQGTAIPLHSHVIRGCTSDSRGSLLGNCDKYMKKKLQVQPSPLHVNKGGSAPDIPASELHRQPN